MSEPRAKFLREQAQAYRRLAAEAKDGGMRDRLQVLATHCEEIAEEMERKSSAAD